MYLPLNSSSEEDHKYTGDKRINSDESRRGKMYRHEETGDTKFRGGNSRQKKYSDSSDSTEGSSDDDRDDKPYRKKGQSHRRPKTPSKSIPTR